MLLAACLTCLQPLRAASKVEPKIDTETPLEITGSNPRGSLSAGTFKMDKVTMRQGATTTIRAAEAAARGLKGDDSPSTWDLSGTVHIEFNNVVLDADSFVMKGTKLQPDSIWLGNPAREL